MAAFTASMHAGQGCAITTRLVVPRARYDDAVAAAAATMSGHQTRRSDQSRNHLWPSDFRAPTRSGAVAISTWRSLKAARFACGGGRPADRDRGLLHRTHGDRRSHQRRPGRPGGDLRPGADGDRPRRRRRCGPHRQRLALRAVRDGVQRRPGTRAGGRQPAAGRHRQRQRRCLVLRRRARSADTSSPASAGRWAWRASRSTSS